MTPQEQPDSQAGDEPTLDELLDLLQSRRSPLLDFNKQRIRDYAERLATKRAIVELQLMKAVFNDAHIDRAVDGRIKELEATLTKEEHHD